VRYWPLTLSGLVLAGASIVGIDWAIYHLVRTGTCASGGPYVSARQCPPGTAMQMLVLIGGIFGALIGAALYAARGRRGRESPVGIFPIMWALLFLTIAASVAYAAYGPAATNSPGSKSAAVIIAVIFVPMGIAPLVAVPFGRRHVPTVLNDLGARNYGNAPTFGQVPPVPASPAARSTATTPPDGDPLTRIQRLGELRAQGVITEAEFEEHKRRLLGEL
jgi:hypothetical protein